jgi:hypothetical protein
LNPKREYISITRRNDLLKAIYQAAKSQTANLSNIALMLAPRFSRVSLTQLANYIRSLEYMGLVTRYIIGAGNYTTRGDANWKLTCKGLEVLTNVNPKIRSKKRVKTDK